MEFVDAIGAIAPSLTPLLGMVLLVVVMRRYMFSGLVSEDTVSRFWDGQRQAIEMFARIEKDLSQLVSQQCEERSQRQQVREDLDDLRHMMFEHSATTEKLLAGLRKRQDDFLPTEGDRRQ